MNRFDLEERTAKFAEDIIEMCQSVKITPLIIFASVLISLSAGLVFADEYTSTDYKVSEPVMFSGGFSSSTDFQLFGAISQISIGTSTSASFGVNSGFLYFPFVSTPTVSATAGNGQVALSWTSSVGYLGWTVSGYSVGQSTTSGGPYSYASVGSVTSSTRSGLTNGATYYFIINPEDVFGYKIGTSTEISATPAAPTVACGDGSCDSSETCSSCSSDCGSCGGGGGGPILPSQQPLRAIFNGRAYPNSTVILLKDAQVAASTIANPAGIFQIQVRGISSGDYIFSIYARDNNGKASRALVIPATIADTKVVETSGIFIPPTLTADKLKVRTGEFIAFFGQTVPSSDIVVFVDTNAFIIRGVSDKEGNYRINFDASVLDYGFHSAETQAFLNKNIASELSRFFEFEVGFETIFIEPDYLACSPIDFNNDCLANLIDFSILIYWVDRADPPSEIDLNQDGIVDIHDFSILAYYWTG